jgi:hypothetical protein
MIPRRSAINLGKRGKGRGGLLGALLAQDAELLGVENGAPLVLRFLDLGDGLAGGRHGDSAAEGGAQGDGGSGSSQGALRGGERGEGGLGDGEAGVRER